MHANVCRFIKYVGPVYAFAILSNIPKFLEVTVEFDSSTGQYGLYPTDLRVDPDYAIYYNNFTRLAILGIIPVFMLLFFNAKIYQAIRVSISLFQNAAILFLLLKDSCYNIISYQSYYVGKQGPTTFDEHFSIYSRR